MRFLEKISPEVPLRLGLGLMYLYSGYDLIANPRHWYGFIPQWLSRAATEVASVEAYLRAQGIGELFIGVLLLAWFLPRRVGAAAAFGAALEMGLILIFVGIDPITFRDIGLLGAALTLFLII